MSFLRGLALLSIALWASPLHADDAPSEVVGCLGRLLVATGLGASGTLEVGGDRDVVLVHVAGAGSRAYVFSPRGVFQAEVPWPTRGSIGFDVSGLDRARRYTWHLEAGRVRSQSNAPGPTTIVADRWAPYDEAAWTIVERVVTAKLPRLREQLQDQRDFAARKHMRFETPNGWAEVYGACRGLPGETGRRIATFVEAEQGRFEAMVKAPLELVPYDVVRRQDHPEWRRCEAKTSCVVASGPCGWPDVIAASARRAYGEWAATRGEQINCDVPDERARVGARCVAGQCVDPAATPQPGWSACRAAAECVVDLACDAPIAINRRTLDDAGYQRWRWWRLVDAWDRCGSLADTLGGEARCEAGRCTPAP